MKEGKRRVLDLSWLLKPGKEERLLEIEMIDASEVTHADEAKRGEGWYVMHNIRMASHVGTHVEAPYHALPEGEDLAQLDVGRFVGEAVILDFRAVPARGGISQEMAQGAASQAGGIRPGDMVFCATGYDRFFGTPRYQEAPYVSREAMRWLVAQGIKLFGMDWSGAGDPGYPDRDNHLVLFEVGIPYIENMRNLVSIAGRRVWIAALPLAVEGLESIPLRVVAVVEEDHAAK